MDPGARPHAQKAQLRAELRGRLRALGAQERRRASELACDRLLTLPELVDARTVALYAPLPDELNPGRAAAALRARGVRVVLPRVRRGIGLELAGGALEPGFRGIDEPVGAAVDPADVDVVVTPGLGFDAHGSRLGRGGGHYDRLLAAMPDGTHRVGLAFAVQVCDHLPHEPHDQRVAAVVTESRVLRRPPST